MKKIVALITGLSVCALLVSCNKESVKTQADIIPVNVANLAGNWHLVNDTTTQLAGIMAATPTVGINYIGKSGDYYNFTPYGRLNFHDNIITGAETYKLSHDTVLVEYAYIDARTNQVDSAYSPIYVVTRLTDHNCTMTEHIIALELDSYSTINLSR